jgi:WD40 repeat protein
MVVCLILISVSLRGERLTAGSKIDPKKDKKVRTDLYGDPLPPGALARMGTLRFRHSDVVRFLTFSPDGKAIASVDDCARAFLWDTEGKELRRFNKDKLLVHMTSFSPDGKLLALGSRDGIRLVELSTGKELRRFGNEPDKIYAQTFSPDGKVLAVSGRFSHPTLWDPATGKEILKLKEKLNRLHTTGIIFSPDGKSLALATKRIPEFGLYAEAIIGLWDATTGKFIRRFGEYPAAKPQEDGGWGPPFAMSSDGKHLAALTVHVTEDGVDRQLYVWEVATGRELHHWKSEHQFTTIVFSPDGKTLAVGDAAGNIRLFTRLGKQMRCIQAHWFPVSCLAYAPDGKTLASSSSIEHVIRLWDPATGKELRPRVGHQTEIDCLTLMPDGKRLVTGSWDNTVRLWDPATGKQLQQWRGAGNHVSRVACAPDGQTLAVGGAPGKIQLLDLKTGAEHLLTLQELQEKDVAVLALAFSPDGKLLAFNDSEDNIYLWDLNTRKQIRRLSVPQESIFSVAFSPSGKLLASANFLRNGSTLRLWEVVTGKMKLAMFGSGAVWSPNGKTLAWSSEGEGIGLVEVATGKIRCQLKGQNKYGVNGVAFSPDGRRLASRGGYAVCLWGLDTGKQLRVLTGHEARVSGVAFFPDGKRLVSASADTTALVWDVAEEKKEGSEPNVQSKELRALWDDLGRDDAMKAYQAIWRLAATPKQSVPFLQKQLKPVPPVEPKRLAQLVKDLGSDHFPTREKATRDLEKLGMLVREALEKVLQEKPLLEVRKRVEMLLDKVEKTPLTRDELRALRAVEALEYIGNAEARKLLEQLARGAPGAPLTEDAKETLQRLDKKTPPP